MDITFINVSRDKNPNDKQSIFYDIVENVSSTQIGHAEGYLTPENYLIAVIHIIESFQKKGIGKLALRKLIDFWGHDTVRGIVGSWHADEEFAYLEQGMSTNLRIFKTLLLENSNPVEAALKTPTGKWTTSLGFNKVHIQKNLEDEVCILFTK